MPNTNEAKNLETGQTSKDLAETIQRLAKENEALRYKVWKHERKPTGKIGYVLLVVGFWALFWSIISISYILAFVGVALSFWGALLLFIRPTKYIKAELLSPTALPSLIAVNRILENLNHKGKGIYLPPKLIDEYMEEKLFIPSKEDIAKPPARKLAKDEVFYENPQGMLLTPSGLSLADLFEDELGIYFTEVNLNYLQANLPRLFIEGLEMAEDFEMSKLGNKIRIKVRNSIYKDFCGKAQNGSKKLCKTFACPFCSSIACALTRVARKPVILRESRVSSNGEEMEVLYEIIEE